MVTLRFNESSVRVEQSVLRNEKEQIKEIIMFVHSYGQAYGYKIERAVTDLYGEYKFLRTSPYQHAQFYIHTPAHSLGQAL